MSEDDPKAHSELPDRGVDGAIVGLLLVYDELGQLKEYRRTFEPPVVVRAGEDIETVLRQYLERNPGDLPQTLGLLVTAWILHVSRTHQGKGRVYFETPLPNPAGVTLARTLELGIVTSRAG